ncbi:hypothetical protein [Bradyrhizobium sp. USDA 4473]
MGQAKRRNAEVQKWLEALSPEEKKIADAARRLITNFIDPSEATGMCYRLTYFLHLYLLEKGIKTIPVIGYVNDGTDDVFMSHAWLEYEGKKTDLTLARPERPHLNPPGDILIQDFPFRCIGKYTYHLSKTPAAVAVENAWLEEPQGASIVRQKAVEHEAMKKRAENAAEMRSFLDAAPDGITYDRFKSIIAQP